jgi:hypothetical protein
MMIMLPCIPFRLCHSSITEDGEKNYSFLYLKEDCSGTHLVRPRNFGVRV